MRARSLATPAPCADLIGSSDILRFFVEYVRDPRGVAAVLPSGLALAALITRHVGPATGPILELGAGTGVFTQALIDRGIAPGSLTLVEKHPRFAHLLRRRFPGATVIGTDAASLFDLPPASFGAAICGLGLLNMPPAVVEAILRGAFAGLRPGGALFLFTYKRGCSVPDVLLDRLDLVATRVGGTFHNLPPASVYRIERRLAEAR